MTTTDLIHQLEDLLADYGDIPVMVHKGEDGAYNPAPVYAAAFRIYTTPHIQIEIDD